MTQTREEVHRLLLLHADDGYTNHILLHGLDEARVLQSGGRVEKHGNREQKPRWATVNAKTHKAILESNASDLEVAGQLRARVADVRAARARLA